MKKYLAILPLLLIVQSFVSCKKIISLVFPGKDVSLPTINVTLPAIPLADSSKEYEAGSFTNYINVDSIIKANTGGSFGIGSVSSVKVKQVTVSLKNADIANYLSAFKTIRITIASNANTTPADLVTVNIPASATDSYTETPGNSPDITNYLKGTSIYNTVYGNNRKTTSKTLNMAISIVVRAN